MDWYQCNLKMDASKTSIWAKGKVTNTFKLKAYNLLYFHDHSMITVLHDVYALVTIQIIILEFQNETTNSSIKNAPYM